MPRSERSQRGVSRKKRPGHLAKTRQRVRSNEAERCVLIVAGMHRSGTSAVARVLSLLGASLPRTLMTPIEGSNPLGFWESARIRDVHEELLSQAGSAWDDVLPIPDAWFGSPAGEAYRHRLRDVFLDEFGDSRLAVLKDPRICRLLPLWLDVVGSLPATARVVIPFRHPLEVAESLAARDGLPPRKALLLWAQHLLIAEHDSRGTPRCFVPYDQLLADPAVVVSRLGDELGMDWPRPEDEAIADIRGFVSSGLRHHSAADRGLTLPDPATELLARIELLAAQRSDVDPSELDRWRLVYRDASRLLGPFVRELEAGLAQGIERERAEEASLRDARDRDIREIARLSDELSATVRAERAAQSEVEAERESLRARAEEVRNTRLELAHAKREIRRLEKEREQLTCRLRDSHDELERAATALRHELTTRTSSLESALAALSHQVRAERDSVVGLLHHEISASEGRLGNLMRLAVPAPPPPGILKRAEDRLRDFASRFRSRRARRIVARVHVDAAVAVPGHGVFVAGWALGAGRYITSVRLVAGGRRSEDLLPSASRTRRPDVTHHFRTEVGATDTATGFSFFSRNRALRTATTPLKLLVGWSDGAETTHPFEARPPSREAALEAVLGHLQDRFEQYRSEARVLSALDKAFGPAMEAIARVAPSPRPAPALRTFGRPPAQPSLSIVVPVYGRLDLVEYQLCAVSGDPALECCELIYVIDDPRLEQAPIRCAEWSRLYGVPFHLLTLPHNVGFAGACNTGAAFARAVAILFLNSDVMPKRPGWPRELLDAFAALPDAGVLGVKLLWEDDSVQHVGVAFHEEPGEGIWLNKHPFKGVADSLSLSGDPFPVPAVTGAALMILRDLFQEVGGFDEGYLIGCYEDTDLCLKAVESGAGVWVAPDIELYHLEGQSQAVHATNDQTMARLYYNAWRQHTRWGAFLRRLADEGRYRHGGVEWIRPSRDLGSETAATSAATAKAVPS